MELRSVFVLYIDYCKRKSLQKRVQSPVLDILSSVKHKLQASSSCNRYLEMQQRCIKNWMNASPEVVAQITRDFDLVGVDARWGRRLRSCLYYGKTPSRV